MVTQVTNCTTGLRSTGRGHVKDTRTLSGPACFMTNSVKWLAKKLIQTRVLEKSGAEAVSPGSPLWGLGLGLTFSESQ